MTLQDTLKQDLVAAMREKDESRKSAIRVIMGEIGRQDKKSLSDDEIIRILKKTGKIRDGTPGEKWGDRGIRVFEHS